MPVENYIKSPRNTNPAPGATSVPAAGFPFTHNQQTAGSASARRIWRAAVFVAEAQRLLLAEKQRALCRNSWLALETAAANCGRLVGAIAKLE
jgi:hypothetical protein